MPNPVEFKSEKVGSTHSPAPRTAQGAKPAMEFKTAMKKAHAKPVQVEAKAGGKSTRLVKAKLTKSNVKSGEKVESRGDDDRTVAADESSEAASDTLQAVDSNVAEKAAKSDAKPAAGKKEPTTVEGEAQAKVIAEQDPSTVVSATQADAGKQRPDEEMDDDTESEVETNAGVIQKVTEASDDSEQPADQTTASTAAASEEVGAIGDQTNGGEEASNADQAAGDQAIVKTDADGESAKATKKPPTAVANQPASKSEHSEFGAAPEVKSSHPILQPATDGSAQDTDSTATAPLPDRPEPRPAVAVDHVANEKIFDLGVQPKSSAPVSAAEFHAPPPAPPTPPAPPEAQFAEANHASIVTAMHGQLLPDGGTMHIRLDPPELGALQVSVHMQDGVMTASFQTSNDEATKLLSHSMAQLKNALESQGVTVDKMHVSQAPRDQQASNEDTRQQQQNASDNPSARQEQQRREILQRMWRRLTNGSDPLDMVA